MRPNKQIEKWFADWKAEPSAELDARVHQAINDALAQRKQKTLAGSFLPNTWRMIMKTPITRWTATAVAVTALVAGLLVLDKTAPSAFGLDQVIAASKGVRFVHIKTYQAKDQEPNEFWIVSDASGHVARARYFLPSTPQDGAKLITWTPERTEVWFQTKHGFLTTQAKEPEQWMQSLLAQCQPQLVTEQLKQAQTAGKVDLEIQQPTDKEQPIKMVAVRKNDPDSRQFYWIDQKTDLISSIEYYRNQNNTEVLVSKTEFLDYNVPIDDKMFSLRDQLPPDVRIADQLTQVSGVAQGNLTDEQAAAQTAREFFQALMDKDYKKAGLITGGALEQYVKDEYGKLNVTALLSIGPAIPQPDWEKRGFKVPSEVEITHPDGQKTVWKPTPYVRPGDNQQHPDHWHITGGVSAAQAEVTTPPDNKQ
jgi:hypothetical protein